MYYTCVWHLCVFSSAPSSVSSPPRLVASLSRAFYQKDAPHYLGSSLENVIHHLLELRLRKLLQALGHHRVLVVLELLDVRHVLVHDARDVRPHPRYAQPEHERELHDVPRPDGGHAVRLEPVVQRGSRAGRADADQQHVRASVSEGDLLLVLARGGDDHARAPRARRPRGPSREATRWTGERSRRGGRRGPNLTLSGRARHAVDGARARRGGRRARGGGEHGRTDGG